MRLKLLTSIFQWLIFCVVTPCISKDTIEIAVVGASEKNTLNAVTSLKVAIAKQPLLKTKNISFSRYVAEFQLNTDLQLIQLIETEPALIYVTTPLLVPLIRSRKPNTPVIVSGVVDTRATNSTLPNLAKDKLLTGYLFQQTPPSKRVEHLVNLCQGIKKIAYVTTLQAKKTAEFATFYENEKTQLHRIGVVSELIFIDELRDLNVLRLFTKQKAIDAFDIVTSQFVNDNFAAVLAAIQKLNKPYVFSTADAVEQGAAFSVYPALGTRYEKVAALIEAIVQKEPFENLPLEINLSQTLSVRYAAFSKMPKCDADRAIKLATVRLP